MKIVKYISFIILLIIPLVSGCASGKPVSDNSKIVQHKIESKIIEGILDITVYLPKWYSKGKNYPVLYTLHGSSGNSYETQS